MHINDSNTALHFAIRACEMGSSRDFDIWLAITAGDIVKNHGFSTRVVSAAYLLALKNHPYYTINDLTRMFGRTASSILTTINPDENKPKQLKELSTLSLDDRALIAAVAIAKLERQIFEPEFNQENMNLIDYEKQKLYYRELLNVLEEESQHPIFDQLHNSIYKTYMDEQDSIKEKNHPTKSERLSALLDVLKYSSSSFIVGFSKDDEESVTFEQIINDFLNNDSIILKVSGEDSFNQKYHDKNGMSKTEAYFLIASEIEEAGLLSQAANDKNLFLVEQGLFDRLIWLKTMIKRGGEFEEKARNYLKYGLSELANQVNYVKLNYTNKKENINDPEVALKNVIKICQGESVLPDVPIHAQEKAVVRALVHLMPIMPMRKIKAFKDCIEEKRA